MLDGAEQPLDVVRFRAERREVIAVDPALSEIGPGFPNLPGTVEADAVEHNDGRDRGRWQFAQEVPEVARAEMAAGGHPGQRGGILTLRDEGHDVQAPALGILVRHPLALAPPHPGQRGGLAGAEAAFVEVAQADAPLGRLFFSVASVRSA